jgi:ribose 5-phosphate isomerase A
MRRAIAYLEGPAASEFSYTRITLNNAIRDAMFWKSLPVLGTPGNQTTSRNEVSMTEQEMEGTRNAHKALAARLAVEFVRDDQVVGLGTGSTAAFAIKELGVLVSKGLRIRGVPTSKASEALALKCGIQLVDLKESCKIDVTIDGADEIDPAFDMIKGGGGALFREKLLATVSDLEIIIVDPPKLVSVLGATVPVPVEVIKFGWCLPEGRLRALGCTPALRQAGDGHPYESDNGNYILDCRFGPISDPASLDKAIKQIPGVVESGIFAGLADRLIIGSDQGPEVRDRPGLACS